jgi:hypothetical protein
VTDGDHDLAPRSFWKAPGLDVRTGLRWSRRSIVKTPHAVASASRLRERFFIPCSAPVCDWAGLPERKTMIDRVHALPTAAGAGVGDQPRKAAPPSAAPAPASDLIMRRIDELHIGPPDSRAAGCCAICWGSRRRRGRPSPHVATLMKKDGGGDWRP